MTPERIAHTTRTWLFVPGDRPERFAKAGAAGADVVVLDLEDAVPASNKDAAREHVARWQVDCSQPWAVRVNASDSVWHLADLAALGGQGPALVVLPKSEDPKAVATALDALPAGRRWSL